MGENEISESKDKNNSSLLIEWAVWTHLISKTDPEIMLLKGHLLIEVGLESVLKCNGINEPENFSFYKKVTILENIVPDNCTDKFLIIQSLKELNKLRNKLAHDFHFKMEDEELAQWSQAILKHFKGQKWTNYTYRTKIAHSFSVLSKNIWDLIH